MEQECLVVAVKRYSFVASESGELVRGMSVIYLADCEDGDEIRGCVPVSVRGAYELFDRFSVVPGVYRLLFGQRPTRKGPVVFLRDAQFVDVANVFNGKVKQ